MLSANKQQTTRDGMIERLTRDVDVERARIRRQFAACDAVETAPEQPTIGRLYSLFLASAPAPSPPDMAPIGAANELTSHPASLTGSGHRSRRRRRVSGAAVTVDAGSDADLSA
jgi:hypothetical protein